MVDAILSSAISCSVSLAHNCGGLMRERESTAFMLWWLGGWTWRGQASVSGSSSFNKIKRESGFHDE
jgi:hypothetical protein